MEKVDPKLKPSDHLSRYFAILREHPIILFSYCFGEQEQQGNRATFFLTFYNLRVVDKPNV